MRRILCVILLGGLLLTMLSGCTSREPSPESGSESRTASASEPLSPEDPLYEEVLRTLGAEKTEDGLLVATPCSLLTVNWAEPEDLEGYRYCHWYMEQLSDLPAEEKRARYTPPEGETGWLIPDEELEQAAGGTVRGERRISPGGYRLLPGGSRRLPDRRSGAGGPPGSHRHGGACRRRPGDPHRSGGMDGGTAQRHHRTDHPPERSGLAGGKLACRRPWTKLP